MVTAVVYPGGHFIDPDIPLLVKKHLHRKQSRRSECGHQLLGQGTGFTCYFSVDIGRTNLIIKQIELWIKRHLDRWVGAGITRFPDGHEYGDLFLDFDLFFQHGRCIEALGEVGCLI